MHTHVTHRFAAMALSVVVTLGIFHSIEVSAHPDHSLQRLVLMQAPAPAHA